MDVVVATTAFGMGIDRPDLRFVAHLHPAESLDAYYQELGRAGRDGTPAEALLFYRPEDLGLRRFFAATGQVDADQVRRVAEVLVGAAAEQEGPVNPAVVAEQVDLSATKVATAVSRLERVGAVEVAPTGEVTPLPGADPVAAADAAAEEDERHQRLEQSRVDMLRACAETLECRRGFVLVLNYFGEAFEPPCGNCDNCDAGRGEPAVGEQPFALNSRVSHAEWGEGLVTRYERDRVTVLFDSRGYVTLSLPLVLDGGLLRAAGP